MFVMQTVMYRGHHKIDKYRAAPSWLLHFTMQVCPKGMTKGRVCTSRTRECTISKTVVTMDRSRMLRGNERRTVFPCTRRPHWPLRSRISSCGIVHIQESPTHTHTIQKLMRAVRDGITIKNRAILCRVFDNFMNRLQFYESFTTSSKGRRPDSRCYKKQ